MIVNSRLLATAKETKRCLEAGHNQHGLLCIFLVSRRAFVNGIISASKVSGVSVGVALNVKNRSKTFNVRR